MTTLNLPLDEYDASLGLDLVIGLNNDLTIDNLDGDLATLSGAPMVSESIRRRIMTTPEGYARLVKVDENYMQPIGLNYGSKLRSYLSNPMTAVGLTDKVPNEVQDSVQQDVRVSAANCYFTEVNNVQARLGVALNYRLQDLDDLSSSRVSIGEFTVAGLTSGTVNRNYQLVIPVEG